MDRTSVSHAIKGACTVGECSFDEEMSIASQEENGVYVATDNSGSVARELNSYPHSKSSVNTDHTKSNQGERDENQCNGCPTTNHDVKDQPYFVNEEEESKPECDKQFPCNEIPKSSLEPQLCIAGSSDSMTSSCGEVSDSHCSGKMGRKTPNKSVKVKINTCTDNELQQCESTVPSGQNPPTFTPFNNNISAHRVAHCKPLHTASVFPLKKPNIAMHGRYTRNRGGFDSININHSNSNSVISNHNSRFVDFFKPRKMYRTGPAFVNGKRSNNYLANKAQRPTSSTLRSKQALLANISVISMNKLDGNLLSDIDVNIDDSESKLNYGSLLPVPVLVHVFSYLPLYDLLCRASRVCKYWCSTVMDPALWRYVNLSEQNNLTDDILLKLTSISDNLLSINLSTRGGPFQISPEAISKCISKSPNLQELKMSRCFDVPAEAFMLIGDFCQNLIHLDLDICSNVTNETIIAVGKGCPKLNVLFLGQCSNVKNTGIVEIARGCPLLQQLKIEQCDKITDPGVIELTKYCHDMNYLHMLSCSLTDSGICQLVTLTGLKMLDISNVTQLSPKVLAKVVQSCVKLEILNVSLNRAVDDECIKMIVMSCPNLKNLSCVACRLTDNALNYVGEYGKHVEHLDVAWCVDITNNGVRQISNTCTTLRYLGLMQCRKVTFETIDEMIDRHPQIHYSNFVTESRRILKKACMNVGDEFQTLKVLS